MKSTLAFAAFALLLVQQVLAYPLPVPGEDKNVTRPISQMSERERNGLRGLVKSCIVESTYPKSGAAEREAKYWQKTEYDLEGRTVETRGHNSNGSEWVNRRTYDASGRPLKFSSGMEDGPTAETLYSYDDQGRLLRITNSGSSDNPVTFHYDEHGRKTKVQTSRPADYRPGGAVAGSPFESADMAPNLPGGGTATTIYDEQDRPVELQIRDSQGGVVSRATRTYNEQGRVVEEKVILDTPETIIPAELRTKILEQSGASLEELRQHLTNLMGGQSGPSSLRYSYDAQGRITQTRRRIFNEEQSVETTYNEHGDVSVEVTRAKKIGGIEEGTPAAGPPRYSETHYSYEYDAHDNWTRQTVFYRSSPDGAFESSTETRRTLSYY
jgi:YD repeat-containing protein